MPLDEVCEWTQSEGIAWLRAAALATKRHRDLMPDENALVLKEVAPWLTQR